MPLARLHVAIPTNGKFCSRFNYPQGYEVSEWLLSMRRNSTTTKLNTLRLLFQMTTVSECRHRWLRRTGAVVMLHPCCAEAFQPVMSGQAGTP
jgi:hypothetical protein